MSQPNKGDGVNISLSYGENGDISVSIQAVGQPFPDNDFTDVAYEFTDAISRGRKVTAARMDGRDILDVNKATDPKDFN